jgi:hypothetical protein
MIKTKASYDFVMKNIEKVDEVDFAYIPELGKKVQVVVIDSQLYLADSSLHNKTWLSVNRDTLADGPLPPVPVQQTHISKFSEKVHRAIENRSTPPPPYSAHISWPFDSDVEMTLTREKNSLSFSDKKSDRKDKALAPYAIDATDHSGKKAGTLDNQTKQEKTPVRPRKKQTYFDPVSGDRYSEKAPGLISSSTWSSRKMVKPEPGGRDSRNTPGLVSRNTQRNRRLVDPIFGKTATEQTLNPVPYYQYRNTRLVDPLTGETASKETENPIPFSRFLRHGYKNRDTGERVKPGSPGAIPAAAYIKLLAELKI